MKIFRYLPILIALLVGPASAMAVTESEMEQARTIAAQLYLRYANNGSGYLDELHPKTMQELEKGLKAKEKENIKAFKSISVPSDYAGWDKAKLVEYWSSTAFKSSGLLAEGKAARTRVKARINAMSVSKPAEKPVDTPEAAAPAEEPKEEAKTATEQPAQVAEAEAKALEEAAIEADSIAAEEAIATEPVKHEDSSTWIYVAILVVLIIIVIALVIYATRAMKDNEKAGRASARRRDEAPAAAGSVSEDEMEEMREKYGRTLAAKNDELQQLRAQAEKAMRRADDLENRLRRSEMELGEARAAAASFAAKEAEYARREQQLLQRAEEAEKRASAAASAPVAAPRAAAEPHPAHPAAAPAERRVIYLGRVNARGIFVRAARRFNPANDIYVLETTDGVRGTFYVATDATVAETTLLSPRESLGGGCDGDFRNAADATAIVTDARGEAVFEDGCWRVARKARVSFV